MGDTKLEAFRVEVEVWISSVNLYHPKKIVYCQHKKTGRYGIPLTNTSFSIEEALKVIIKRDRIRGRRYTFHNLVCRSVWKTKAYENIVEKTLRYCVKSFTNVSNEHTTRGSILSTIAPN